MKHNKIKIRKIAIACYSLAGTFTLAVAAEEAVPVSPTHKPEEVVQQAPEAPVKTLDAITVTGEQAGALPTHIPATIESITGKQIEDTINATSSAAALKHFPSIHVRQNYIGDSGHGVMSSRASGTGNSARHLLYADGILLSNLLGNDGHRAPRWEMVTPEEIGRVDVLYGPFSATYSGNSMGAVVDYVTRMPRQFEAHAKASGFTQNYKQYGTDSSYSGHQLNASLGNKHGGWSWRINVNHLDSDSHPLWFANKLLSAGTVNGAGVLVTGAVADQDPKNQERLILGATSLTHSLQDHAKLKLAYDFSPTVRASYTLGWWSNDTTRTSETYLRDASGNPVYSGNVNINGRQYALTAADFAPSRGTLEHVIHGLSVKSNTKSLWDWDVAASLYDYASDQARSPTIALPAASTGGAGRITDQEGSGWYTLALKGIWRPQDHIVDMGYQLDNFALRTLVSDTSDWINGSAASRFSAFNGNTRLQSLYAQDTWGFAPAWKTTLGGRLEQWRAFGGERSNATSTLTLAERKETWFSPKAAIAWQASKVWVLKTALGRAVRMPTVAELYQGTIDHNSVITNNNPDLKPERSWTSELTTEHDLGNGLLRATLFHQATRDALYSQPNVTVTPNVINVQNVEHIRTTGLELAFQANDVGLRGLDLSSSVTWANSKIVKNDNFPASVGKRQPLVPQWRTNLLATYRAGAQWIHTFGARYSSRQYGTLDNSDINGATLGGTNSFFLTDLRVRYQPTRQWSGALGIDNLNNAKYWSGHPSAQRTFIAELKFNL